MIEVLKHFRNANDNTIKFLGTLQKEQYYIDILETEDSHEAWMYEDCYGIKDGIKVLYNEEQGQNNYRKIMKNPNFCSVLFWASVL